ncbi:E3 ubiquitin-protein ligase TRIM11-like isoform X1 [Crotalus tigris]|uniref:E3 ubiquitin-protein ligase TRIM11-like isoform X1 n=1 Tax=Crotalus tigris TaxID=88082 RepID=UPI00192F23D4|nr:E3 ubiquitin-protein ligase TRIM11-like isoform X1 [Crotalus tigris]
MAAEAPLQDFLEEATCSICLDYFQDPVLIPECGHNFCRGCLTGSWGTSESEASCPQCRQTFGPRNVLPNRQLARLVEMARRCEDPWGEDGGRVCPKHREPLKLFCKHHETLICVVCDRCKKHRGHWVIPSEEAFQEYQIKVGDCLKAQKEEKEKIATYKTDTEQRVQEMLDQIKKEKKNAVAEFRELQRWLKRQEKLLLARMEETEKESLARRDNGLAGLCSLDDLIQEIEEKHQQPASKLLQLKVGDCLKAQKEEKEKIAAYKTETEQRVQEMLDQIKKEKKNAVAEFRELQRWLKRQEKLLLARMEETEKEILARRDNGLAGLCSLDDLIQEIEEKHQQPASKLLQDIGSILEKYQAKKTFENPVDLLLEPKWTIWDYNDVTVLLKSAMKKLRDTLETGFQLQEVNIILDPDIPHPGCLDISEDQNSIKGVKPVKAIYPAPHWKRFEYNPYVLGCQRFSTGRHFWEVIVGDTAGWGVGVVNKPVNVTNGDLQTRHWQIGEWGGKYMAISPSVYSELVLSEKPTRIRISVNCEGGQVNFFDARTAALLHTFSDASLVGETLLPSFYLCDGACMTFP